MNGPSSWRVRTLAGRLALAAIATLPFVPVARGEPGCPGTIQWDGGAATTAWTDTVNWSPNVLPGTGDDVCIPNLAAGVEVVHASGTHAVHSLAGAGGLQVSGGTLSFDVGSPGLGQLTLSGGTLAGTGDLPVTGPFAWSGGAMRGAGTTSVTNAAFSNFATKDILDGRSLAAAGTTAWQGTGQIRLGGGGSIVVAPGAIWDVQNNTALTSLDGTGSVSVPAGATFRKRSGGTTTVAVPVIAAGTISAENGTLTLAGGSALTGPILGSSGAKLQFAGGAHAVPVGVSLSAETVEVTAGSLTVDGSYAAISSVFAGGSTTFHRAPSLNGLGGLFLTFSNTGRAEFSTGETIYVRSLSMAGGSLAGSDLVVLLRQNSGDLLSWSGGEMTGTGITTIPPPGTLGLSGTGPKDLTGGRLLEASYVEWLGTGPLRLGSGASIVAKREWTLRSDASILDLGGAGPFVLDVTTFHKAEGSGTSIVGVPFVKNFGEVRVSAGTLAFTGGYTQIGSQGNEWYTLHFGGTVLDGGSLSATTPLDLRGGALRGGGLVSASVLSSGSVQPAGVLRIDGAYTQSPAGRLDVSLPGDRLEVTGPASLAGTLLVYLDSGFVPQSGNTFTVLTASSVTGSFPSRALPSLPSGLSWLLHVEPTSVVLEVVAGADADADGIADADDCAPTDPTAFGLATEVVFLSPDFRNDDTELWWVLQKRFTGTGTVYDVVRGDVYDLPPGGPSEVCLVSGTSLEYVADLGELPSPGTGFYYFVRARNACGSGAPGGSCP